MWARNDRRNSNPLFLVREGFCYLSYVADDQGFYQNMDLTFLSFDVFSETGFK